MTPRFSPITTERMELPITTERMELPLTEMEKACGEIDLGEGE